jgi:F-type H+-transporting ATPase subunit epsilon
MMAATFNFRLVTPDAEVMNLSVQDVTMPGTEGEFGVMGGHMPVISSLQPGVVKIVSENQTVRYFISGGFANVNGSSCTILADTAIDVLQLNPSVIDAEIEGIEARLETPLDDQTADALYAQRVVERAKRKAVFAAH